MMKKIPYHTQLAKVWTALVALVLFLSSMACQAFTRATNTAPARSRNCCSTVDNSTVNWWRLASTLDKLPCLAVGVAVVAALQPSKSINQMLPPKSRSDRDGG